MHTRKQFLPGEGLLVLEVKDKLLEFFVKCCQILLHDIPQTALASDVYPIQFELSLQSETPAVTFDSLATMAAKAPYRSPRKLDLGRTFVTAQFSRISGK